MKHHTIRGRITALLLFSVLAALSVNSLLAVANLHAMKTVFNGQSATLGKTAAQDAEEALEDITGEQLGSLAVEKAALIEEKFHTVTAGVRAIAQLAENIYRNPQDYPEREVALPVPESTQLAAQLLWSGQLAETSAGAPAEAPALPSPTNEQAQEILKLGNLQDLLVQYNEVNDMISSTYLATKSGWMIQADYIAYSKYSGENDIPDYYEAEKRQWFQYGSLAEPGEVTFTDVIMDIHENRECIVCAMPVYADGKLMAVAGIGSYLDAVRQEVLSTTVGESGCAFLINEKGQIMVSGADTGETAVSAAGTTLLESPNASLAEAAEDMVSGAGGLRRLTLDGREVYLAYAPMKEPHWSFAIVMDVAEVTAPARESEETILALADSVSGEVDASIRNTFIGFAVTTLFTFLAAGTAGAAMAGRLSRPIRELTREVAGLDGGRLDGTVCIRTGDEVEELGNAFNHMRAQLKTYIASLAQVTAERERIRTELSVATGIQADMLPDCSTVLKDREDFAIYARTCPAKEVGGDFYDFFLTDDDRLVFLVADVSGKGVPAALFMVVAMTLIRTHLMQGEDPGEAFERVNRDLCSHNKNGMFLTAWLGVLDLDTGRLVYVNAGHNSPLYYNSGTGRYQWLTERSGFILAGMEDSRYREKKLFLQKGDRLFLYSDGVTEANDSKSRMFGDERLETFLDRLGEAEPEAVCLALQKELEEFKGEAEQSDDITMLSLVYRGEGFVEKTGQPLIEHIREFSDFVEEQLEKKGVSVKTVMNLNLALDEVFSNICYYSGASCVTVGVLVKGKRAAILFEDDGIPYDPLKRPDPDVKDLLKKRKRGGLGIYLVKKRMDSVSYEYKDGRNRLLIEKQDV